MDPSGPVADVEAFYLHQIGALLFGLAFLYLWRQSRMMYFGLWAAAWAVQTVAGALGFQLVSSGHFGWFAPYVVFQLAFVVILIAAARVGFASTVGDWRSALRLISILPIFVALAWAFGRWFPRLQAFEASCAVFLCFAFGYHFFALRRHSRGPALAFRAALLALAALFLERAALLLYIFGGNEAPAWARLLAPYRAYETYLSFGLYAILAFAAIAMWSGSQMDRIRELQTELDRIRRENARNLELDHLTGLLNQSALSRRLDDPAPFAGVAAVCDMDAFKDINDGFGHLVGDEILRNVGSLLHSSIRQEDEAYRWGGDEFVILFHEQRADVASKRMAEIEKRLHDFRVRGFGALPISFSWGTADAAGRPLRDALDEADRNMYALKRTRAADAAGERPPEA